MKRPQTGGGKTCASRPNKNFKDATFFVGGMDGQLAPQGNATRAQIATMFMRYNSELEK